MNILYLILFFILGSICGSIAMFLGLRLPQNKNLLSPSSHCDHCGHALKKTEILPIISYLLQKGKCSYCHQKIDILYLYTEVFTGILFTLAYCTFGFSYELLIALGIVFLLMTVLVSDTTYLIIPDEVLIFSSIYFFLIQILNLGLKGALLQVLSGVFLFGLMYLVMILGEKVFKKESLGGGDVKMLFVFGLILDPLLGTFSIFLGSLIALPISLFLLYKEREKMIPFGPFLLIALTCIYFAQITTPIILSWLNIS